MRETSLKSRRWAAKFQELLYLEVSGLEFQISKVEKTFSSHFVCPILVLVEPTHLSWCLLTMENGPKNAAREERSGEEAEMAELRTSLDSTIKLLQFTRLRNLKDDDNAISRNFRIDTTAKDEKKMEEVKRKVGEELTKIDSFLQRHTSLHYPSLLSLHAISDRHKRDLRKMAPTMQQMKDKVHKAQNDVDFRKASLLASLFLRMNSFCREAFLITVKSAQNNVDQLRITIEDLQKKMKSYHPSTSSNIQSKVVNGSQQASKIESIAQSDQSPHSESQIEESFEEVSLPDDELYGYGSASLQHQDTLNLGENHHPNHSNHSNGSMAHKGDEKSFLSSFAQGLPHDLHPSLAESLSNLPHVEEIVSLLSKAVRGVKRFLFLQQRAFHLSFLASLLAHLSQESSSTSSERTSEPSKSGASSSSRAGTFPSSSNSSHSPNPSSKDANRDEAFSFTSSHVVALEALEDEIKTQLFPLLLDPLSSSLTSILSTLELLESHYQPLADQQPLKGSGDQAIFDLFSTSSVSKIKIIMIDILDCYVSIGREGDFAEVVRQRIVETKFIAPILTGGLDVTANAHIPNHYTLTSIFDPAKAISASASPTAPVQDQPLWKHLFLPFLHWMKHSLAWKVVQEATSQHTRPFLHLLALTKTRSNFHSSSSAPSASKSSTLSTQKSLAPLILSPIALSMIQGESEGGKVGETLSFGTSSSVASTASSVPHSPAMTSKANSSSHTTASSNATSSSDLASKLYSISPLSTFFLHTSSRPTPSIQSYAEMATLLFKEASEAEKEGEGEKGEGLASTPSLNPHTTNNNTSNTSSLEDTVFSLRHGFFGSPAMETSSIPFSSPQLVSILTIQSWHRDATHGDQGVGESKAEKSSAEEKSTLSKSVPSSLLSHYTSSLSSFLASSPFSPSSSSSLSPINPPAKSASTTSTASAWFASSSSPSPSSSSSLVSMLKSYLIQHRDDERKVMVQAHQASKKALEDLKKVGELNLSSSSSNPHIPPLDAFKPAFFAILSDSDFATIQGMSEIALLRFLAFLLVSHNIHSPSSTPHAFNLRLPPIIHEGMSLRDWMARDIVWAPFCAALSLSSSPTTSSTSSSSSSSSSLAGNLPSLSKTLFSAGLPPPLLRRNLLLFSQFLSEFETNIAGFRKEAREGALKSIFSLRTHPAANPSSWHLPWNVAGFVSLFTKQIIESFDEAMTKELQNAKTGEIFALAPTSTSTASHYHLGITRALNECLSRIWTPTAWVESLAHRFLKLSLQSFIHFTTLAIGAFDPIDTASDAWIEEIMDSEDVSTANQSKPAASHHATSFLRNLLILHHQTDLKWNREAEESKRCPELSKANNALNVVLLLLDDVALIERKMESMEQYWSIDNRSKEKSDGYLLSNVIGKGGDDTTNLSSLSVSSNLSSLSGPSQSSTLMPTTSSKSSSTSILASISSKALREGAENAQVLIETRAASLLPLLLSHSASFKSFASQMKEIGQKYRFGGSVVSNPSAPSLHLFSLFSTFLPLFCPISPGNHQFESSVDWMTIMNDSITAQEGNGVESLSIQSSSPLKPRHPLVISSLSPILTSIADTFLVQAKTLLHSAQKTQAFLDRKKKTHLSTAPNAANAGATSLLSPTPSPLSSLAPSPSPYSPSLSPIVPATEGGSLLHLASLPFPSVPASSLPDHAKLLLQLLWDAHFLAKATWLLGCPLSDQLSSIFQVLLHDSSASH